MFASNHLGELIALLLNCQNLSNPYSTCTYGSHNTARNISKNIPKGCLFITSSHIYRLRKIHITFLAKPDYTRTNLLSANNQILKAQYSFLPPSWSTAHAHVVNTSCIIHPNPPTSQPNPDRMVCIAAAVNPGRAREEEGGRGLNRPHVWQFGGKMSHGKEKGRKGHADRCRGGRGRRVFQLMFSN